MLRRARLLVLLAAVGAVASGCMAFSTADSRFDPNQRNHGWWRIDGQPNGPENDNYAVGSAGSATHRNFFTFDLADACRADVVVLRLTRFEQPSGVYYQLFDVSTPAAQLNRQEVAAPDLAVYEDLGTGDRFGEYDIPTGNEQDVLSLPLNEAGVAAYNASRGGFFSIGGSVVPLDSEDRLFGGSGDGGEQQLLVACDEPSS